MTLLDKVLHMGAGSAPESSHSSLISAVLSMLSNPQSGGIQGLIEQFTSNGLGNLISSWIGKGENLPISPEQVKTVFGAEQLNAIAAKAGVSPEVASTGLSQILPQLIDRLTPEGEIPKGDLTAKGMELLQQKIAS
jgi:uncharacterized protein YidB (DUF937 family)